MQRTCLRLVYDRKTSGDIARALRISKSTVDSHLAQARRTLGVTRSIEAALLLHDFEAREPSCKPPTYTARVPDPANLELFPPAAGEAPWWRPLVPLRLPGERDNELTSLQRLAWIPGIAIGLAIAFGLLVIGLQVLGKLFDGR